MSKNNETISFKSTGEIVRYHGLVVGVLYWVTEVASWLSIGHWLRALPRCFSIKKLIDKKKDKPLPCWQDLVAILYLCLTPIAISMAWSQNSNVSNFGSCFSAYLLYDPIIYHIRVLWFDDLKPGILDSRRGVWSHRRILFLAIAVYIQSIFLFPSIYHQVHGLRGEFKSELIDRSLSIATSLSLPESFTCVDMAQLSISIFLMVIVIATTASIAYGRKEIAKEKEN